LYAEHWRALSGYAGRRCGDAADAADVVSETFLICWRRLADVPVGPDARLWLFGTARRVIANQRRFDRRRERLGAALLAALTSSGTGLDRWFQRSESDSPSSGRWPSCRPWTGKCSALSGGKS